MSFLLTLLVVLSFFPCVQLQAQDVADVENGRVEVKVKKDTDTTRIEASDGAIIRYNSFDINAGETVQFDQPGKQARVLNRIRSGNPSRINGNLFANGQVFLTNPAGIVFGSGATVDVGRLYAAAGRISNDDFRNGINQFTDLSGTVKNLGHIRGSQVHLLGNRVANFGNVVADAGVVTMTSGEDVLIGSIDDSTFARITDNGDPSGETGPSVENDGTVRAADGTVQVGAGDVYSMAIESTGDIYAEEIEVDGGANGVQHSGTISADGMKGGTVSLSGDNLEVKGAVTARGSSGTGGTIDLSAGNVRLLTSTVDASGTIDGGRIDVTAERIYHENTLRAAGIGAQGGTVTLDTGARYTANSSAEIDVSGESGGSVTLTTTGQMVSSGTFDATGSSGTGGTIDLGGPGGIGLLSAELDASGATGGGTIRVGGNRGDETSTGDLTNAHATVISQGTNLVANATGETGSGGDIIVRGESEAEFYGEASALPGLENGAGGFVELSSEGTLEFTGEDEITTGREHRTGSILIDPKNISIVSSPPSGTSLAQSLVDGTEIRNPGEPLLSDNDYFGTSVALNGTGDILAVGAPFDDTGGSGRGATYVFRLDTGNLSGTPSLEKKIADGTGSLSLNDDDHFGNSAALNGAGDILTVGAPDDDTGAGEPGAAYVFRLDTGNLSGTPSLEKKIADGTGDLTLSDAGEFGSSTALNGTGDILTVGAPDENTGGSERGAAYVFGLDTGNLSGTPSLEKKIANGTGSLSLSDFDHFGSSAALNGTGDILVVGASDDDTGGLSSGAAYVFRLDTGNLSGTPSLEKKIADGTGSLTLSDTDEFGSSAALNAIGDILAVGAPREDTGGGNRGAAYLFRLDTGNLSGTPSLEKKIADGTGGLSLSNSDGFGSSAALNGTGDILAVGTPFDDSGGNSRGAAYVFRLNTGNLSGTSSLEKKIADGTGSLSIGDSGYFGGSAALNGTGDILTVGAPADNTGGFNRGAAYVFSLDAGNLSKVPVLEKKIADGTASLSLSDYDSFGSSAALNGTGDIMTVGSEGNGRGAAYVFSMDTGNISGTLTLEKEIADGTGSLSLSDGDDFGSAAALNETGNILTVGAARDDTGGTDRGAMYVFSLDTANLSGTPTLEKKIAHGTQLADGTESFLLLSDNDRFGGSAALNGTGDILAVGAPRDDTGGSVATDRGAAYVFRLDTGNLSGAPALEKKIADGTASLSLSRYDEFGTSVALNGTGDILTVGTPEDDTNGSNRGAAYVFSLDTTNLSGTPAIEEKIVDGTGGLSLSDADHFGSSAALNGTGDILTVGASVHGTGGASFLFERNGSNSNVNDPNESNFSTSPSSDFFLLSSDIVSLLDGSDLTLQANNDIEVGAPIDASTNSGVGDLALEAGRDIVVGADIQLNGGFSAIANAPDAQAAHRESGEADFLMDPETTIDTSVAEGPITIELGPGPSGSEPTGALNVSNLKGGSVHLTAGRDGLLGIFEGIAAAGDVQLATDSVLFGDSASVKAGGGSGQINLAPETVGDSGDTIHITSELTGDPDVLELRPIALETRFQASDVLVGNPGSGSLSVFNPVDIADSQTNDLNLVLETPQNANIDASIAMGEQSLGIRAGGDIILNNAGTVLSTRGTGNRIDFTTQQSFVNNVGPDVLDVSSGARWLMYSIDPDINKPGGLIEEADFEEFGVTPPNDPVGAGSGIYYAVTKQVEDTNITTDISSSTVDQDTTADDSTTQQQEDDETQTTQTTGETQTKVETDTLLDEYSDQEISESLSEVEEPSSELTSMVDEPTQGAANDPSYDQKIQDDATQSYDNSQGVVKQTEEQIDNLEAQAEELENQGETEQADEKREQAEELREELEQAQQQLNQAQQQTDPSPMVNQQLRQRVQQESTQVRESLNNLDMEQYQNQNQVGVTNMEADGPAEQPSNISAQEMRDKLVEELRTKIEEQSGPAHPAQAGTVNKLAAKDPIKGVGGSHIRSVSMSGTKAVPEANEDVKTYYDELTEDVKDWDEENTLRFQIMGGGGEGDWGFGLINIFLNRETGVYLMRSNLDILEGAASKIQETDFGSNVDQNQVKSFEGDSTSLTVSGRLQ